MHQTCQKCQSDFEITASDLLFYKKVDVPAPVYCPDCRQQVRLCFENERALYKRKCDLTGKSIISIYSTDKPFKIYDQEVWWSDKWNPLDFGRDFDFKRPFFEQFQELMEVVPRRNLVYFQNENSEYINFASNNKDCYLLFFSDYNKGCFYSSNLQKCVDCVDCSIGDEGELCYECFNFQHCYQCLFSTNVENCSECFMVVDCKGSRNCAFSSGLRNKQFCICNKQYTEQQYKEFMTSMGLGSEKGLVEAREKFRQFLAAQPRPALNNLNNQNSFGDYLYNSKNCFDCFNTTGSEDSKYIYDAVNCKDCFDGSDIGYSELCYEVIEGFPNVYNSKFVFFSASTSEIEYCDHCYNSHDLFACVGLKHNEYCIFNKQYSKEEYVALRAKIVNHLKNTGEWGKQFPSTISPFAYNETVANKWFPLEKSQALAAGFKWKDEEDKSVVTQKYKVSANISEVNDDILNESLVCEKSGKAYKIIPVELAFYRKLGLPVPLKCPDQRNLDRRKLSQPRHIYDRNCAKCGVAVKTTYAPTASEIVWCDKCYLAEAY